MLNDNQKNRSLKQILVLVSPLSILKWVQCTDGSKSGAVACLVDN